MNKHILVFLADGFEEAEAVIPIDVWRRLGFRVTLAGIDSLNVNGAHNIGLAADCLLSEVNISDVDGVFLPGGMPGAKNMKDSTEVIDVLKSLKTECVIAAICAAPIVLAEAGLIGNKYVTCYPGFEDQLGKVNYTGNLTEVDGRIITGKGPGAAFELAEKVAGQFEKKAEVTEVLKGMIV